MFIFGWTWNIKIGSVPKKSVIVCAPHTSNWDFYFAVMGFWALEIPIKVIIKDTHTKAWYGKIVEWMGGIGIDRKYSHDIVHNSANIIKNTDTIAFIITPEGTRKFSANWKKGFYFISKEAKVPIIAGIGDYKNKQCIVDTLIDPSNKSYEEVCDIMETIYKPEQAKYPEMYNPKIY